MRGTHQGQQSPRTASTGRTHDCKRPLHHAPHDLLQGGGHPHMRRGHVGEEDMPYAEARRLLSPDHIVGVTCGAGRDRAITAAEAGADYVAFGAFFPSMTKAAKHHADPELLRDWNETTVVPCCAIGGITQDNCGPLVEAGADFLAVIGAIWSHPKGPRAAVAALNEVFLRYGRAYLNC
jgi:thiamine monophosphate synthase